ncbi:solute carrier family 26 member 6 [Terrapene carolina triunguis]|uniref:solute carrier family 26 member 6 n=1 Tax=Terrapene triunguis TaxID=2587831 RepID=UPI000E77F4F1|nr:solute carrier family 26 member 6 [Terrapene carolina triunguis]
MAMEQSELRRRPWASQADSEVLSEAELEEIAPRTRAPRPSLCSKVRDIRCSCAAAKSLLFRFLPILSWLPRYPVRDWLLGDIVSGFSVGIMHLPQGLAYALLAGVPPVTGLYSSFYPVFLYFLFGTSRHISVGPFAVISVMIGSVTGSLMPDSNFMDPVNGTNETVLNEARRDSARVELVATLTILVGVFQMALGMLQFGFVVTYLSEPLVRGYTTAAAVQVLVSQLKYVFGVEVAEQSGPLSMFAAFIEICTKLPQTNVGALVTSLIAMAAILAVKLLSAKFASKLPMPIPIELITIIVSTGISYGAGLKAKFGISVVGDIPSGMKPPVAPNVSYFGQVVGNAFAIAVVGYAICISLGKIFALKHGYKVNSNQELIALGICNFVGGFFQCFSISCSMSRTLVQETTGGNSQVAGVIASLVILVTILKIGQLFQDLPKAILAAIIIVNLKGMFKQFTDIRTLWRSNRIDLLIWLVTFVATLLLNLDMGLGVSVAFALLTVIFRTQMPRYSILGQVSNTDIYRDVGEYNKTEEIPGVKIFRSSATVYFANAELYAEALKEKSGINVDYLIGRKKKALKKQKKQQEKDKKEEAKKKKKTNSKLSEASDPSSDDLGFVDIDMETNMQELGSDCNGSGPAVVDSNGSTIELEPQASSTPKAFNEPTLESLGLKKPDLHSLILDFTPINFVDTVCIKILKNIFRDFQEIEVDVFLVGCHASVIDQLEKGNFFSQTITKHHLFASVHDAITYVTREQGQSMPQPVTTYSSTKL